VSALLQNCHAWLAAYVLIMSVFVFFLMGLDKGRSKRRGAGRVSMRGAAR
jgi:uncharacterized membrane protein YsdA (DUF1294 family)